MFKICSAEQAISTIQDGDRIVLNSFLALSNPEVLHHALYERIRHTGHPRGLKLLCSSGFGGWSEKRFAEPYIALGAVEEVIASHYASMPVTTRMALESKLRAYCLPLGVISHAIRAMAGGNSGYLSKVGLGLYVDPRQEGPGMNALSQDQLVECLEIGGEEFLYYHVPRPDVAFIKGTAVDANGNITFENEYMTGDALSVAQATKAGGGKVIVQVDRVTHVFSRPRNVIVPGVLVDAVVVAEPEEESVLSQTLSGDIHVPSTHMDYWMNQLDAQRQAHGGEDASAKIIGRRGAKELYPGHLVNIGIGIPEQVGKSASEMGVLKDITLTVESGGMGGLPAPGKAFGATIGADMICDIASQFDFYDGGGLDVCFMGGLEVDVRGNVNVHRLGNHYVGVGGFANITSAAKTVVFCLTFRAKGLVAKQMPEGVQILSEGSIQKFKRRIQSVSFSAEHALRRGQRVLYVTERCVFELTSGGLRLKEVYPGIDAQTQIINLLDFELKD